MFKFTLHRLFLCLSIMLVFPSQVFAKVNWHDMSITLLHGENFETGDSERNIVTFEDGADYSFGDHFFFVDAYKNLGKSSAYGELLMRFSLNKNIDKDISSGWFKDVLLAVRLEHVHPQNINNQAYGFGFDWSVPGFQFLKLNLFTRRNDRISNNELVNGAWGIPWNMFNQKFLYDGFFDWVSEVPGSYSSSFNITSQLKWEVTRVNNNPLYVGVEYIHWNNKFGINGLNERNLNVLVKMHF